MVRHLVLAVRGDQGGAIVVVAGVSAEHREQRNADPGQPFLVGRDGPVELGERVSAELRISSIESMSVPSRSKRIVGRVVPTELLWRGREGAAGMAIPENSG